MKEVGDAFEKWRYKTNKRHAKVPVIAIGNWHFMTGNFYMNIVTYYTFL